MTITSEQKARAQTFLALHTNGELLILPNIWNPIGARVLEHQCYPAVATASASIPESLGYEDGEHIRLETMLESLFRISRNVSVPVAADIEAGYADTIETLKKNILRVMEMGSYECFTKGSLTGKDISKFLISGKEPQTYY